jgi:hypothetical protein
MTMAACFQRLSMMRISRRAFGEDLVKWADQDMYRRKQAPKAGAPHDQP